MTRRVVEVACPLCGQLSVRYEGQELLHWVCKKRPRGAEPPRYREVQEVKV